MNPKSIKKEKLKLILGEFPKDNFAKFENQFLNTIYNFQYSEVLFPIPNCFR